MPERIIRSDELTTEELAEYAGEAATVWSRRDFFSLAGWGAIAAVLATSGVAFIRFMFPRVLFEPNPVFVAGRPESYVPGTVDERFKLQERVWIVRIVDKSGIFRMKPGQDPDEQYPQSVLTV